MTSANANQNAKVTREEALRFHEEGKPGKIEITPTKPLTTQKELSLAYSPGVAEPCLDIHKNPEDAYRYTSKGNLVAVISNGTAVLGLGNLGALASKPVMEGKAVLFKRFADIDGIDLEVATEDPEEFINAVKYLGPTWGGINLEDIKAPECFIIEQRLKEIMDIPVFHDDQHGTAIISVAGLLNALDITGRKIEDIKVVANGAGAASIACIELMKAIGVKHENVILCDSQGVIYQGRTSGMNQWKSAHAVETETRSLAEALVGADVFLGLSVKGAVTKEMVKTMAENPIIFAMANPNPEITPEEVLEVRDDAIIATGRSDYNNQVNNVMGFPYIFRGALDVRAKEINQEMKIAAARALAGLAREPVSDEVSAAYAGRKMEYGPEYIIPTPFDPRLIYTIPVAVAKAAVDTGVAKKPITDWDAYVNKLKARLNPTANNMNLIFQRLLSNPRKIIFAEGEEETVLRTASEWRANGYGIPVLVGRRDRVEAGFKKLGVTDLAGIEIHNAKESTRNEIYIDYLTERLERQGFLRRDCVRMVKNDRNIFAACMLACGDGDALVTGLTRSYSDSLKEIRLVIDPKPDYRVCGISQVITKDRTVFIADTAVTEVPSASGLAKIAVQVAEEVRHLGHEPRVALLSFSNFGNPMQETAQRIRDAVKILDTLDVDFEYEGEMAADVALNSDLQKLFPFCRLSAPANVLIMPALHSASISFKLIQELGGGVVIGPILTGLSRPVQIVEMGSSVSDVLNLAALAAVNSMDQGHLKQVRAISEARIRKVVG
ncbi:MAG: NADP-dependent malic enzyme [Alphaproteobacteria bacterium]|nr:NADP-dependent malic enzyme [Alphaproteobacteria bacterium]